MLVITINIVLVYGTCNDRSSWSKAILILRNAGHSVISVQLALHSVGDYIATVKQTINQTGGPVTAVGNSYGGHGITNSGLNDSINIRNSSTVSKSKQLILGLIISVNMNMLPRMFK